MSRTFFFHRRFAYLNDISIAPELSLPLCIIKWFSQDQADEFLGFNSTQNFYQRVKSIYSYFRVGSHRFISASARGVRHRGISPSIFDFHLSMSA